MRRGAPINDDWRRSVPERFAVRNAGRQVAVAWGKLLVVGVLCLLSVVYIAMPVAELFRRGPHAASSGTACHSNLKQIAIATMQYAQDYDDRLPLATCGPFGASRSGGWVQTNTTLPTTVSLAAGGSLFPYLRSSQVYHCPNDHEPDSLSYAIDGALYPTQLVPGLRGSLRLKEVTQPDKAFFFREVDGERNDGFLLSGIEEVALRHPDRHPSGANFAFVDGHVKWLKKGAW